MIEPVSLKEDFWKFEVSISIIILFIENMLTVNFLSFFAEITLFWIKVSLDYLTIKYVTANTVTMPNFLTIWNKESMFLLMSLYWK